MLDGSQALETLGKEGERQLPNAKEGWGFACLGLFSFFRVEETLAGNKREYKKRLKITLDLSET